MRKFTTALIFNLMLMPAIVCAEPSAPAVPADFLYNQARRIHLALIDSPDKKSQRSQWVYCIEKFRRVRESFPDSVESVKALYSIASLYQGMHGVFGKPEDLDLAMTYFQMVEAEGEAAQLADDALFQVGEIQRQKGNFIKANIAYENILQNYPLGDQVGRAKQRLSEIQPKVAGQVSRKKEQLQPEAAVVNKPAPVKSAVVNVAAAAPPAGKPAPAVKQTAVRHADKKDPLLIIIDPGHGGKDEGAKGVDGLLEKEVNLAVAREVRQILEQQFHYRVELTRDDDTFIPVQERGGIANEKGAALFVSIHANAAKRLSASGIETYYLGFGSGERASETAARENGGLVHSVQDDQVQAILANLIGVTKINDSSRLAARVQSHLVKGLSGKFNDVKNLGVKEGPFYVLHDTNMPSILIEMGFVTNAREESRLKSTQYRKGLAQAVAEGIHEYLQEREPAI